jgi:N-acetyl-anhydromuramyl-L-alanine amidase AmpD
MLNLNTIPFEQSPNYHLDRSGQPIKYLIIHAMIGSFNGSIAWFKNPKSKVSAHYLIGLNGQIMQMVHDKDTAWHCWGWNQKAIGIENEDLGKSQTDPNWMSTDEYNSLVNLAAALVQKYNIPLVNVIGHNNPEVQNSCPPKFKHYDPGPYFNFTTFHADIQAQLLKES